MDDFVEVSAQLVEFVSKTDDEKLAKFRDASCGTDAIFPTKNEHVQVYESRHIAVQTESLSSFSETVNDQKLAIWLRKMYPVIEAELLDGVTQTYLGTDSSTSLISLVPYQQITHELGSRNDYNAGAAAWLSIRVDNVPALAVSSSSAHKGWCEHIDQTISFFIPKRVHQQQYIVFTEIQKIPVKACVQLLVTNGFSKNILAGITVACDLYIWKYQASNNFDEVKEVHCTTIAYAAVVGADWLQADEFLTAHSDGFVCLWKLSKELMLDKRFKVNTKATLTAILAMPTSNFLVGTEEGRLLFCSSVPTGPHTKQSDILEPVYSELEKHEFPIIYLSKGNFTGMEVLISYDLSGEFVLHDVRNSEDGPILLIKMPLPFKNNIVCTKDVEYVISAGIEGTLDIFRTRNGQKLQIKGNWTQKESFIKLSDNGCWLIVGVRNGIFQIFSVKDK